MTKYTRGTVDSILASVDVREEELDVPEWGVSLLIRGLTKRQQLEVRKNSQLPNGESDPSQVELNLFMAGVVEPEFKPEHFGRLLDKSTGVIDRVNQAITDLSGLGASVVADVKESFPAESGGPESDAVGDGPGEDAS